jgi:ribosome-binding protein aMBF1 (putative translation factor)
MTWYVLLRMRKPPYRSPTRFDVALMQDDMDELGWIPADLARKASTSHVNVHRFFHGRGARTARMAKKLADALGQPLRRYIVKPSATPAKPRAPRRSPLAGEARASQ